MSSLNLKSLVLLSSLLPTIGLSETFEDMFEKNGLFYKKFTNIPFSGQILGIETGQIRDGKRDGPWEIYSTNGRLKFQGNYRTGEKNGLWEGYYDNGGVKSKENYKNGEKNGL